MHTRRYNDACIPVRVQFRKCRKCGHHCEIFSISLLRSWGRGAHAYAATNMPCRAFPTHSNAQSVKFPKNRGLRSRIGQAYASRLRIDTAIYGTRYECMMRDTRTTITGSETAGGIHIEMVETHGARQEGKRNGRRREGVRGSETEEAKWWTQG